MSEPLIRAEGLSAGYGEVPAIRDVDLQVRPGELVVLLGANGAGKTTTVLTLAGELRPMRGTVVWKGSDRWTPLHRRARQGLSLVAEERSVISRLTVSQNLRLRRDRDDGDAYSLFPELKPLASRRGALLSGGEQQMLALARALSGSIDLLVADEMSLGLGPQVVERLLTAVRRAVDGGIGALVVEQHVGRALQVADRAYVLRRGRIVFSGAAADARDRLEEINSGYLPGRTGEHAPQQAAPQSANVSSNNSSRSNPPPAGRRTI